MLPHLLGRLGILLVFDLIDFPRSVISPAEASDGKFASVADSLDDVFSLGDGAAGSTKAWRMSGSAAGMSSG